MKTLVEFIAEAKGLSNDEVIDLQETLKKLMNCTQNDKFITLLKHIRSFFNSLKNKTDYGFEIHVSPRKNPSCRLYDFANNCEYIIDPQGDDKDDLSINKNDFIKMVTTNKSEIKYVWLPRECAEIIIKGIEG